MTLTTKHKKYLGVIALLVMVLAIKSFTRIGGKEAHGVTPNDDASLAAYTLFADTESNYSSVRDIFTDTHVTGANKQHKTQMQYTPAKVVKKQEPPLQSVVNETPNSANDGEFERVRLLGIVFHDNKKKAFLALDKQRVIADVGDLVYGRYLLQKIAVDSAGLVDTKDNVEKTILVSGK